MDVRVKLEHEPPVADSRTIAATVATFVVLKSMMSKYEGQTRSANE